MSSPNKVVSYSAGLVLALILTLTAFSLAFAHVNMPDVLTSTFTIVAILVLAMTQLVVQLVFFLHLGREKAAQWNTVMFCFTFFGVLIVVLASVWIMNHLNYNMTPTQVNQYIINQSSF